METKFKDGDKTIKIVTQQYEIGLYVAIYENNNDDFIDQGYVDMTEEEYHKGLREKYKDSLID